MSETTSRRAAAPSEGVSRIISGGQTGADRGGLDAAIALGIPHGGWCPKGRLAEDGVIPTAYQLTETENRSYQHQTNLNVLDADATLIFTQGNLARGTQATKSLCTKAGRPWLHVDLSRLEDGKIGVSAVREWLSLHKVRTLNVAGDPKSKAPGIQQAVARFLQETLRAS